MSKTSQMPPAEIGESLRKVQDRIEEAAKLSRRPSSDITLVAVSKKQSLEAIAEAFLAGQRHFGENFVQEALEKQEGIKALIPEHDEIHWHFLGHIQKNKVKYLAGRFALIHSIDNMACGQILERRLPEGCPPQKLLVQVNIGEEAQKSGIDGETLFPLLEDLAQSPSLCVEGLMCLPPYFEDSEKVRPYFVQMRKLIEKARETTGLALPVLSMGMSNDFHVAIEEGATCIRVGSDIFGERI